MEKRKQISLVLALILISSLFFTSACESLRQGPVSDDLAQRLAALKEEGPRKRVIVLPAINDSIEKSATIPKLSRQIVVDDLHMTDNFVIIDNSDLPKDPQSFLTGNKYDMDKIAPMAMELGVIAVLIPRVTEIKAKRIGDSVGLIRTVKAQVHTAVEVQVVGVNPRRDILIESRSATAEGVSRHFGSDDDENLATDPELIHQSVQQAFDGTIVDIVKAIDKLNWAGRIALISGNRIYINAGKLTGINVGDILRVSDEGEDVYDSQTGALIGHAPGRMKGTLEVVSYFGKDGAITTIHSGSGFKPNDHVELY